MTHQKTDTFDTSADLNIIIGFRKERFYPASSSVLSFLPSLLYSSVLLTVLELNFGSISSFNYSCCYRLCAELLYSLKDLTNNIIVYSYMR